MRAAVTRTAAGLRGLATAAAVAGSPLAGLLNSKRYAQVETGFRATPSPSADDYAALMWSRVRTGRRKWSAHRCALSSRLLTFFLFFPPSSFPRFCRGQCG